MVTHLIKYGLVLAGSVLLAACASSPSPWSESSSPWGKQSDQPEVVAAEPVAEHNSFVEPVVEPEVAKPIEVIEPEPIHEVAQSPVIEEAPVMQDKAVAGDLHSQPGGHFAVQVCASRTMKQLNGFARRHSLSTQWTTQTNVKGETWFVLLEGVYATRAEADQALSQMKNQVDTRPWIRTMSSLQAVMK